MAILLQSALLGYEPAMLLFSQWPPVDFGEPNTSVDAFIAYLRYSGSLTGRCNGATMGDLQRDHVADAGRYGDPRSNVLQALGLRALPADPTRCAHVRAYVREGCCFAARPGAPDRPSAYGRAHAAVERVLPAVDEAGRRWATADGGSNARDIHAGRASPVGPASEQAEEPTLAAFEDICGVKRYRRRRCVAIHDGGRALMA